MDSCSGAVDREGEFIELMTELVGFDFRADDGSKKEELLDGWHDAKRLSSAFETYISSFIEIY